MHVIPRDIHQHRNCLPKQHLHHWKMKHYCKHIWAAQKSCDRIHVGEKVLLRWPELQLYSTMCIVHHTHCIAATASLSLFQSGELRHLRTLLRLSTISVDLASSLSKRKGTACIASSVLANKFAALLALHERHLSSRYVPAWFVWISASSEDTRSFMQYLCLPILEKVLYNRQR